MAVPDPGMNQLRRELEQEVEGIRQGLLDMTAELAGAMIDELVIRTEAHGLVLSGAYRASHAVLDGNGIVLYESVNRPPGDQVFSVGYGEPPIFGAEDAPSGEDAAQAIRDRAKLGEKLELWNGRFYASQLERFSVYGDVVEFGRSEAERLAEETGQPPVRVTR